jgi:hypothetical protein
MQQRLRQEHDVIRADVIPDLCSRLRLHSLWSWPVLLVQLHQIPRLGSLELDKSLNATLTQDFLCRRLPAYYTESRANYVGSL